MIKSYRDVKSGLELSRKIKVASRTSHIESSVRKEIEGKYGDLSRFSEDVTFKEKARRHRQNLALEKSRLKLFIAKEKLSRLQQIRSAPIDFKKQDDPSARVSSVNDNAQKFRRFELKY
jgi:hypothetical protein